MEEITNTELGFGDDLDGSKSQRRNSVFGPAMGYFRTDNDGYRPFRHDLSQKSKAVHTGHHQVGDDDIGHVFLYLGEGNDRVGGYANPDTRIGAEHSLHDLADYGRVVDHKHVNAFVRLT